MKSPIELAVSIPQTFPGRAVDPEFIRTYLQRAEALGFHSAWVVEQILGSIPSLEPVELLTWAAALTERVRLGVAVLLTALRSPVHLAKSLATLDHVSGGRLIVGVGLGGDTRAYPAYGISAGRRVARFAEGVRLMKRLWAEPRVTFEGEFWKIENAAMEPKPVQKPHPPVWFGAHRREAIRRAVELGDGFIGAGASSVGAFVETVRTIEGFLAEAGRDPATFPISKRVYIALDENRARAGERLREWFGAFYGDAALADRVSVRGNVQECVDGVAAAVAAGAGLVILNPVFDERAQLERLAAEVVPPVVRSFPARQG